MNSHAPQGAATAASRNETADTCSGVAGFVQGVDAPRAKILRGAPNPWMQRLRARAQATLARRIEVEGVSAFSRLCNVSRALVMRWLDAREVDQHPAPLALLWAVDDDEFESLYVAIRADRRAMREGR